MAETDKGIALKGNSKIRPIPSTKLVPGKSRPRKRPRLRNLRDMKNFGIRLVRQAYIGEMTTEEAGKFIYMLEFVRKMQEAADLEKRVKVLEDRNAK